MEDSPGVEIRSNDKGRGVFAAKLFTPGDVVWKYVGAIVSEPDGDTLQIDVNRHLKVAPDSVDVYFNHGCTPNVRVDFENLSLVAISEIRPGEEIVFNYLTAE